MNNFLNLSKFQTIIAARKEPFIKSNSCLKCLTRYNQAILPCWWQRSQEDIFGKITRTTKFALCLELIYTNN